MLGRLIQTAASYGRGNATLESATEESHTRNLLYGQSHNAYYLVQSPPSSPFATPTFRPGSFDDRGGLELEEKDVRILIAQDAFGAEEKPTLLFDSRSVTANGQPPTSHTRHASMAGRRSPIPGDWKAGSSPGTGSNTTDLSPRNRRGTTSTMGTSWSRPARETGTREEAFLECMFGVTSSTKAASTTKMHFMPGKPKTLPKTESRGKTSTDANDQQSRRAPLQRSRTSNIVPKSAHPSSLGLEVEAQSHDAILITRLFNVALSETVAPTPRQGDLSVSSPEEPAHDHSAMPTPSAQQPPQPQQVKKPKLVERKVPAFAIGLIVSLPRITDGRSMSTQTRPHSRSAHAHNLSSASSSYGSDMQNSWTFLNAIPESLASSTSSADESDRRIETIVANEDVLLRAIALLEAEAARVIHRQLQWILDNAAGPLPKTPKEKSMQRINQRVISITDAAAVSRVPSLKDAARHVIRRVIYALRIPRVITGLGFGGGHWTEEARTVFRICGRRQQNFFLFTLLTAFLGQHTQWLQRLAPDWYQRQYRTNAKDHVDDHVLSKRTIIVCDQRTVARRLIFLLASFLPSSQGIDGIQRLGDDFTGAPYFSTSSPSFNPLRNDHSRRSTQRRLQDHRLQPGSHEKNILSTSIDSTDSATMTERPRRFLIRKDSDGLSIKDSSTQPVNESEGQPRKIGTGTTSAIASHPATPVPVFSTTQSADQDGYFPTFADAHHSVATAGLASILRRSSSSVGNSSNVSSRWGSLVSGLSDLLVSKQPSSAESGSVTAYSPTAVISERGAMEANYTRRRPLASSLQDMVDQVGKDRVDPYKSPGLGGAVLVDDFSSPTKSFASMPRLKVDDKDGVIDVDLDLPSFRSPTKVTNRLPITPRPDVAESMRSVKMAQGSFPASHAIIDTNVAGFLKRHHEDFSLQAVRSYTDLETDIKRSMLAESPPTPVPHDFGDSTEEYWTSICTTVIADLRNFSVRRVTLKRKIPFAYNHGPRTDGVDIGATSTSPPKQNAADMGEKFDEEEIKDFDTTLADAVEKVLDLEESNQPVTASTARLSHSRTASASTTNSTLPSLPIPNPSNYTGTRRDFNKHDCRQVVLGALEEIVKDVCNELSKVEMGRDIHEDGHTDITAKRKTAKSDNVLREGVKCWLLNLEQLRSC